MNFTVTFIVALLTFYAFTFTLTFTFTYTFTYTFALLLLLGNSEPHKRYNFDDQSFIFCDVFSVHAVKDSEPGWLGCSCLPTSSSLRTSLLRKVRYSTMYPGTLEGVKKGGGMKSSLLSG